MHRRTRSLLRRRWAGVKVRGWNLVEKPCQLIDMNICASSVRGHGSRISGDEILLVRGDVKGISTRIAIRKGGGMMPGHHLRIGAWQVIGWH